MLHLNGAVHESVDAIPLGNGLSGGLLWGKGRDIYLSLDRGDLWDLRPSKIFTNPEFTYDKLVAMVREGRYDEDKKMYQLPGGMPTKVPGARLVIRLADGAEINGFSLNLQRALGSAEWRGADGAVSTMECFFSERPSVAMARFPGPGPQFHLAANRCFTRDLKLPAAKVSQGAGWASLVQPMADGFSFAIHVQSKQESGQSILAISITTSAESSDPLALARQRTTEALDKGYDPLLREHEQWWNDFWNISSVQIPDEALQRHYNLVQYLYGAGSRRGSPPIALQGVWTWDNGQLPPWRGDYHNDLNTQLTYWAYQTSGRFDAGLSFLDFLWALKPEHERWAQRFFGVPSGHIVPADSVSASFDAPPGTGSQRYRVYAYRSLPGAPVLNSSPSLSITLDPNSGAMTYGTWAASYGLGPDSAGDESPAGDGIKNLMKYALGINPNLSGFQGRMDEGMLAVSGTNYFMLRYTRPEPAPSDVTYQVRAGDSLTATNWVAEITEVSSTVSNSLRTITVRDTVPMSQKIKRYLMMKVTKP